MSVVVFGACSPIGRAIVTRLSFNGHSVAVVGTNVEVMKGMENEANKIGTRVSAVALGKDEKETMEEADKVVGGMTGLVFIPPSNQVNGDIMDATQMQFNTVFAQRLTLPFRVIKAAIPHLKKQKSSSVVMINSSASVTPFINLGLYSAASSAMASLARTLSTQESILPIRVNSIITSTVHSDGSGGFWDDKEKASSFTGMIPLGRLGSPVDVAEAVQFLLSDRARYITGESIALTGGMQLRL